MIIILQKYQFKIQQKQSYIDQMAGILKGLNKTAPDTSIDADPEDFYVDDDFEFDDDSFMYDEYNEDDLVGDDFIDDDWSFDYNDD